MNRTPTPAIVSPHGIHLMVYNCIYMYLYRMTPKAFSWGTLQQQIGLEERVHFKKYKIQIGLEERVHFKKYKLDLKNAYTSKSTKQCKEQYNNYKQEAEDYFYVMETATTFGGGGPYADRASMTLVYASQDQHSCILCRRKYMHACHWLSVLS